MNNALHDFPIFICGHPKSGTSLLRSVLDSHPQVVAYPEETAFFRRYLPKTCGRNMDEKLLLSDQLLTHIFEWNRTNPPPHQAGFLDRDYSRYKVEDIRKVLRQMIQQGYRHDGDLLSATILAFGKVSGQITPVSIRWLEKTPYNEYYASQIYQWWPEARCIHVVRDPRDNFVSYRKKHPNWTAEFFARNWLQSTRAGLTNQRQFGRKRYLLMRYEDFTLSPEESIQNLCIFLGIEIDPSLRKPTRGGSDWQGNSMFDDSFDGISDAAVGRWTSSMTPEEILFIEWIARSPMRAMQYQFSGIKLSQISLPTSLKIIMASLSTYVKKLIKEKIK